MESERLESLRSTIKECIEILEVLPEKSQLEIVSKEELQSIRNLHSGLGYYNSSAPRVFLMGEFKTGKSSLVNALLDKDYAPTDILEMTAWVSKFWKGDSEYCKINFNDNTFEYANSTEFLTNCEKRKYEPEYLKKITVVEFGIKDLEKNYILIDTPGFGSINSNNEKKLIELVYEADVILFTVDAESIGSMKEAAIIKEYINKGIPYFIVVTKIDLVEGQEELEEIKRFIQKEYKADESKIITASTHKAHKGNNLKLLEEKIEEFAKNFDSKKRQEVEYGFLRIIAERLLSLLNDVERILIEIQKRVDSFSSYIISVSGTINKSLQIEIEDIAKKTLLQNKRVQIIEEIGSVLSNSYGNISEDQLLTIFKKHLGEDFLEFANKNIWNVLNVKMKERWVSYLDEIKEKSINVFSGIKGNTNEHNGEYYALSKVGDYDIQLDQITSKTFSRGIKGTLGFAGVLTAYAAWFGPAAAAVTLPMALTGVGIPIAVVGAGISGLLAYKKRNQTKDMIISHAEGITDNVVIKIVQNVIMPNMSKQITSLNNDFSIAINNQFYNENMIGMNDNFNIEKIRLQQLNLKSF